MHQVVWGPGVKLEELEKAAIMQAFRFYGKNKTATANSLGISVRTLDAKLEKYTKDETDEQERAEKLKEEREVFLKRQRFGTPDQEEVVEPEKPKTVETPRTMAANKRK